MTTKDEAATVEFGEGVGGGNTERVYEDEPVPKRPNRAERRHGKRALARKKAARKASKDAARARVQENPRLVRHKF